MGTGEKGEKVSVHQCALSEEPGVEWRRLQTMKVLAGHDKKF